MNPTGTIPTIDDDGFVLWESNAIVKYLCAKHSPGNLSPTDPHDYADADRWISWQGTTLWPPMRQILLGLVRTPEDQRDGKRLAELIAEVTRYWTMLDGRLKGRDYVMGDRFTMADIVFGPHIYRWFTYPIPRPDLPHLRAWYERFCERRALPASLHRRRCRRRPASLVARKLHGRRSRDHARHRRGLTNQIPAP